MKGRWHIGAMLVVSLMFGWAVSTMSPYPYNGAEAIFSLATSVYLAAFFLLPHTGRELAWLGFGLVTFACFGLASIWFWFGTMTHGWWYPPTVPLVQQFYVVDGEAGYDATAANLGFMLWVMMIICFTVHNLTRRLSARQGRVTREQGG